MTSQSRMRWIFGLDTWRFILALWVLFSHLDVSSIDIFGSDGSIFGSVTKLLIHNLFVGVAAVIAFFVISGIVIHFPYVNNDQSFKPVEFIIKRYIRIIIPMLAIFFLSKIFKKEEAMIPFWSLYCELIYYTLYPILRKISKKIGWYVILSGAFIGCFIIILTMTTSFQNLIFQNNTNYLGNYHNLGIAFTWIIGLPVWLLGVLVAEKISAQRKMQLSMLSLNGIRIAILFLSIGCSIARFHFNLSYMISLNFLSLPIAFWIYCEISNAYKNRFTDLMERAGKWSYSLYICHSLIIVLLASSVLKTGVGLIDNLILIVLSLIASYLFYLAVENPSHRLAKKIKFGSKV